MANNIGDDPRLADAPSRGRMLDAVEQYIARQRRDDAGRLIQAHLNCFTLGEQPDMIAFILANYYQVFGGDARVAAIKTVEQQTRKVLDDFDNGACY